MSDSDVKRLENKLQEIVDILHGTEGQDGMVAKVNNHDRWIKYRDKDFYGTFNFVYRTAIAILIGYVAWKVGLMP